MVACLPHSPIREKRDPGRSTIPTLFWSRSLLSMLLHKVTLKSAASIFPTLSFCRSLPSALECLQSRLRRLRSAFSHVPRRSFHRALTATSSPPTIRSLLPSRGALRRQDKHLYTCIRSMANLQACTTDFAVELVKTLMLRAPTPPAGLTGASSKSRNM